MTALDRRLNRTWSWTEMIFLAGMVFVGFWLVWLELAMRVGGV